MSTSSAATHSTGSDMKSSGSVTFRLKSRSRSLKLSADQVSVDPDVTQFFLCQQIAQIARLPINRVRATLETTGKAVDRRFHQNDAPRVRDIANEGTVLVIKDLGIPCLKQRTDLSGPQVSWRFVFVVEYLGPIITFPMFYYFAKFFYGRDFKHSYMQS